MNDSSHNYWKLKQAAQAGNYDKKEKFKRASKEKFNKTISKKINTTMIGAIAKMENYFGEIWGHGLKKEDKTQEQLEEFENWQKCRDEILNLGNSQIRAVNQELNLYDIEWKDYTVDFKAI